MAETNHDNKPENKTSKGNAARSRTLIVTVISTALLVGFAVYTLLKTDFKTYPDVNISEITRQPDVFGFSETVEETPQIIEELPANEVVQSTAVYVEEEEEEPVTPPEHEQEKAETQLEETVIIVQGPTAEELEKEEKRQEELFLLKDKAANLEYQLNQRDLELQYLHEELDATRRQLETAVNEQASYEKEEVIVTQTAPQNDDLKQLAIRLEAELATTQFKARQAQEAAIQADQKARDLELRNRDLSRRQETMLKEREQLEEQLNSSQQKLVAQERSFQELTNAVKGHKEAMRRMDQARIELATELESTKNQYAKLLQAVGGRVKEGAFTPSKTSTAVAHADTAPVRTLITSDTDDAKYHVVSKGDTLTSISRQYYGTSQKWNAIYDANKAVISDQNRLKVGLVLVIPE